MNSYIENYKNEKVKKQYYKFLKGANGYSEATIESHRKSIHRYQEFSNNEDFALFNDEKADDFKNWLEKRTVPKTGALISLPTYYNTLRFLKKFFIWLCSQPGYKSKICATDIEYLNMDRKKRRMATSCMRECYPTFEQIKRVASVIQPVSEVDLRDRALIAFTLLSGMRDSAIASLPIGCFDLNNLMVDQDPKKGVKTKNSKHIKSYLLSFDDEMLKYVIDWVNYLKTEKLFGNMAPAFPRTKSIFQSEEQTVLANEVEPVFWQDAQSIRSIFARRFKEANVEYFSPHTFRHVASILATNAKLSPEELKAVSQNFGHEHVQTTLTSYGRLNDIRVGEVLANIDFRVNKPAAVTEEAKLKRRILAMFAEEN